VNIDVEQQAEAEHQGQHGAATV